MSLGNRNEADTRADLIDPKLVAAGWGKCETSYIRREFKITQGRIMSNGKREQPLSSDYVLEYRGRKLAAVEAKQEKLSYKAGIDQAKKYATRLQCRIAYATNGHDIYQIDMRTGQGVLVEEFLTPDDLWRFNYNNETLDFVDAWRQRFASIPFQSKGDWQPRYYQENAINNTLDAIATGKRRILLTLATGTGKTCIAFQIAWKLFHSRWSLKAQKKPTQARKLPRILFLADRNILADQAFNDFSAFDENAMVRISPSEIRKNGEVPQTGSIFFTIFQTFMSGNKEENGNPIPYFGDYPEDFFDFIIIDECHRGGAHNESVWRDILHYFAPAVQLGLTATPKQKDNVDTYDYFGEPVYTYRLREGIDDGFLTPFKVQSFVGTMDEYVYTPGDGVVIQGNPEVGRLYKEGDFNRIITIPEREYKRIREWMNCANPHEKTLVFCANQEHAEMVCNYINQYAVQKGWTTNSNYCVRVTSDDGAEGERALRAFQDNEKNIPTILTTSRKLSTGVDARNVRHIVLMRPCNDIIEFKQILGRGTRLYENKDYFTLYDFVKAYNNFSDPDWDGEPISQVTENDSKENKNLQKSRAKTQEASKNKTKSPPEKIVITLSDGKVRQIMHISSVMYWGKDGKPVTAKEFIESLFGDLPRLFADEDHLRSIWGDPTTREHLLNDLDKIGYDSENLEKIKYLINAEDSDVYDILAFVAYATETRSRLERVKKAKPHITKAFSNNKQQEFIDFILDRYITDGVEELAINKINPLIKLKYKTISDAAAEFGSIPLIRDTFVKFQKFLYKV
jgi:type I restriction enzyme, R subunit